MIDNCSIKSVYFLLACLLLAPHAYACKDNPEKLSVAVDGARAGNKKNYYVVQIPDGGSTTVTITGSGDTPCPTTQEQCVCKSQTAAPATYGDPIYNFGIIGAGKQTPADGKTITWTVDPSTTPNEYQFQLASITQNYQPCPNGWSGGVLSKTNSQASDIVTVCAVRIKISPSSIDAIESQDSGDFTVSVQPATATPSSYSWLSGPPDAWPTAAGNNPVLNYSAASSATTHVATTRWFAPTNDRRQAVDGFISTYNINCQVVVVGVSLKALIPAFLNVNANLSGSTTQPFFQNEGTIGIQHNAAVPGSSSSSKGKPESWTVSGIGSFSRSAPSPSVNLPNTSQFYVKAITHENTHVNQWTSEAPWKDLFNASALYNNTLKNLSSTVSEADLRSQILSAILAQGLADKATADNTHCDREAEAFHAENAVAPHFLELDDSDWKPQYNCP